MSLDHGPRTYSQALLPHILHISPEYASSTLHPDGSLHDRTRLFARTFLPSFRAHDTLSSCFVDKAGRMYWLAKAGIRTF